MMNEATPTAAVPIAIGRRSLRVGPLACVIGT